MTRRVRSQYEIWRNKILRLHTIGCLPGYVLWAVVALILLGYLIFHNLPNPFDALVAQLLPSSPPSLVFVAVDNLPVFTVLSKANLGVEQNSQIEHTYSNDQIEQQAEQLYNRITLRSYMKGDKISSRELGPKLTSGISYQIREIAAASAFSWMHSGDTLNLLLIDTTCSSQNPVPAKMPSACFSHAPSHVLTDVVILQVGTVEKDGTIPLLVAIPDVENKEELALLDHDIQNIIAYPETNLIID